MSKPWRWYCWSIKEQSDEASNRTFVYGKQFPGDDGGHETNDNGNILKHIDGYERLVAFTQVSNHTKCNMVWPFDNPPELEGVGETSCTSKASVLPTFIVRFKFDYVGDWQ
jgi:hypothetical protein